MSVGLYVSSFVTFLCPTRVLPACKLTGRQLLCKEAQTQNELAVITKTAGSSSRTSCCGGGDTGHWLIYSETNPRATRSWPCVIPPPFPAPVSRPLGTGTAGQTALCSIPRDRYDCICLQRVVMWAVQMSCIAFWSMRLADFLVCCFTAVSVCRLQNVFSNCRVKWWIMTRKVSGRRCSGLIEKVTSIDCNYVPSVKMLFLETRPHITPIIIVISHHYGPRHNVAHLCNRNGLSAAPQAAAASSYSANSAVGSPSSRNCSCAAEMNKINCVCARLTTLPALVLV
jgi:hypothetical protein